MDCIFGVTRKEGLQCHPLTAHLELRLEISCTVYVCGNLMCAVEGQPIIITKPGAALLFLWLVPPWQEWEKELGADFDSLWYQYCLSFGQNGKARLLYLHAICQHFLSPTTPSLPPLFCGLSLLLGPWLQLMKSTVSNQVHFKIFLQSHHSMSLLIGPWLAGLFVDNSEM